MIVCVLSTGTCQRVARGGQKLSTTQSPADSVMWNWWMFGMIHSLQRTQTTSFARPTSALIMPSGVSTQSNSGIWLSSKR